MSETALSAIAEINPSVCIPQGITGSEDVSFIPMSDVSESGDWITQQRRSLRSVATGFTSFKDGDVLVAKITPCLENGKGAHAIGLCNGIGFGSTEFHVLRAKPGIHPRFVFHVTQSRRFRQAAERQMVGSAGQQRVQRQFFDEFLVRDFSSDEQVAIAQILDTLDTAIRETKAIIDKLKAVKQGLLHDLLTRGIDANGELRPPQSEAPHLYKQSPLGWIPKEWECETVGSVIEGAPRNGIYKPVGDIGSGVLLVGQTAFTPTGSVDFALARRARVSSQEEVTFGLRAGDLLVSRVFATREGVGQPVLVPAPSEHAVYESNMMRLRVKSHVMESKLLFNWLKHSTARTWIMSRAFASNQASINRETICNVPVPVPSMGEQVAMLKASNGHESRINSESLVLSKARTLKSGLMDDLLTGHVCVTPLLQGTATA